DRNIVSHRQTGRRIRRHRGQTEEAGRKPVIHLLVRQHGDKLVLPHQANNHARTGASFRNLNCLRQFLAMLDHPLLDIGMDGVPIDTAASSPSELIAAGSHSPFAEWPETKTAPLPDCGSGGRYSAS